MIDWASFAIVAVASMGAAVFVVLMYALGIKLLSVPPNGAVQAEGLERDSEDDEVTMTGRPLWATLLANTCFTICGIAVLFGIYLIVPVLHR